MSWAPCQELWQGPSRFHPLTHTQARPAVKFYEGRLWLAARSHSPYNVWFLTQTFMPKSHKISTRVYTSLYGTQCVYTLFGYVHHCASSGQSRSSWPRTIGNTAISSSSRFRPILLRNLSNGKDLIQGFMGWSGDFSRFIKWLTRNSEELKGFDLSNSIPRKHNEVYQQKAWRCNSNYSIFPQPLTYIPTHVIN